MKIVTWNAQGAGKKWSSIAVNLLHGDFDVLLLQEVTEPSANATRVAEYRDYTLYEYKPGSRRRNTTTWYVVYRRWMQGDSGNPRCSLATVLRHYRPGDGDIAIVAGDKRPVIAVQPGQGQPLICNLHATSGGGGRRDTKDLIDGILQLPTVERDGTPWVLAGDFNADPDDIPIQTDWAHQPLYTVCAPSRPTYPTPATRTRARNKRYDYAIRSQNLASDDACKRYQDGYLQSDHYPQQFRITAPALMPRAPEGEQDEADAMQVD